MIKKHLEKIILAGAILALGFLGFLNQQQNDIVKLEPQKVAIESEEEKPDTDSDEIFVHITGEINNPGVIALKKGNRLIDAIKIAGGNTARADMENINLALKMEDEMKIHIPKIGETNENIQITGLIGEEKQNSLVDLNNATKEELMTLPNIGEVKAQKIIEYREKQKFDKKEDLKNVTGIGEKTYEELEELISV